MKKNKKNLSSFSLAQTVGNWSDTYCNVQDLAKTLRDYGVRARAVDWSCYEGHLVLVVHKEDRMRAKKCLRWHGDTGKYIARNCLNLDSHC